MSGTAVTSAAATVRMRDAGLTYGSRTLWQGVDLDVAPGEFIAVLGPNGSGKSSLIKVLLGLTSLSSGSVEVAGMPPSRGSDVVGYVPQQGGFAPDIPVRGIDFVGFGLDGHRWGIALPNARRRRRIEEAVASVGATKFANAPVGQLSGGEQQRLRIAQALLGDPRLMLCDEALLSLDIKHQREVVELIDARRRAERFSVLFVTHEINPILPVADRVLYLVGSRWAVGTPAEILTSSRLSELYRTDVQVVEVGGQIVIVGMADGRPVTEQTQLLPGQGVLTP
jgi:zinc/manganese transport system ATP-binding protein